MSILAASRSTGPIEFFTQLSIDCHRLWLKTDQDKDIREMRTESVALRVLGATLAPVAAACCIVAVVATQFVMEAVCLALIGVMFGVLAHDAIVLGNRERMLLSAVDDADRDVNSRFFLQKIFGEAKKSSLIYFAPIIRNKEHDLDGTWIVGDIVKANQALQDWRNQL